MMLRPRELMESWIVEALRAHSGRLSLVEVAKHVWLAHEVELRASGDAFYTWQYDLRWAADKLRRQGTLKDSAICERGVWELSRASD